MKYLFMGTHLKYLNKTHPVSTQTNSSVIEYWSSFGNYIGQFWMKKLYQAGNFELIFLLLNQTYVVGTQKSRLNETALLSADNICTE